MKTFKQWLLEDTGEVHGTLNSEDPAYCARGIRSRFGSSAFSKDRDEKKKKDPRMGFMKSKMKKK